jgi:serine/threonine protein kinase/Flp pilus assembly protein TadD
MTLATWQLREQYITAYEAACASSAAVELEPFLPPAGHPLRGEVLVELVRIQLEQNSQLLVDLLARFPELAGDREGLARVAFEDYRQRCLRGEHVSPEDYKERFGIDTDAWPVGEFDSYARATRNVGRFPAVMAPPARETTELPMAGQFFLGFELIQELGRGAFGRVFLALETALSHRYVVLKVSEMSEGEPQVLARLQHTNVVPVYSLHAEGALQAVCMPYFGGTTLADIDARLAALPALPVSGRFFVDILDKHESSATDTAEASTVRMNGAVSAQAATARTSAFPRAASGQSHATLKLLARLSYANAVLWLTSRLADGLAHAHERGIIHSDLKPANVLVTDEGQPMLLDFNLAVDTTREIAIRRAFGGGTLPYMAPEHLEFFRGGAVTVDHRSDLFSLGVILYRLLTGRHPYPLYGGGTLEQMLPGMLADRRSIPVVRRWNQAVTPAAQAIVQHCLHPDRKRRYQSARDLQEDIDRHLQNLPLKYAPNRSVRERLVKWKRRHPRLTSATSMAVFALFVVLAVAGGAWWIVQDLQADLAYRDAQAAHWKAAEALERFEREARAAQLDVYARGGEPGQLERGLTATRQALDRYHVLDDSNWRDRPEVAHLSRAQRILLNDQVADLLLLLGRGMMHKLPPDAGPHDKKEVAVQAMRCNQLAESCYSTADVPRVVWEQRGQLESWLGHEAEARRLASRAAAMPLRTPQEYYWSAVDHFLDHRYQEAEKVLMEATRLDPEHFRAWFLLAGCRYMAGRNADAAHTYDTCIALEPGLFWPWNNRGLCYLRLRKHALAVADFNKALELRPGYVDAYMDRALAYQGLKKYSEAASDLTRALTFPGVPSRAWFMRARVWDQLGDKAKAQADRDEGQHRQPNDEVSWIARGLSKLNSDAPGALADFNEALKLNPLSRDALQNKAAVLAENMPAATPVDKQRNTEEAVAALDKAVTLYPDFVLARSGRGVLLARLGKRDAALVDARESLARDSTAEFLYRVACIYALTTKDDPNDRHEAFRLLSLALRQGFGHDLIATDSDLIPLRQYPEFRKLVDAARALQK